MLSDPVGVPHTFWLWTQGAPRARRPWALLFNRFTVINPGGCLCDYHSVLACHDVAA
jgi:hypothetical protein